jgi:hypothetical protein
MAELGYAFIKNNIVEEVAVFAEQNDALASSVAHNLGYEEFVWVGADFPTMYSTWDGEKFIPPAPEPVSEPKPAK